MRASESLTWRVRRVQWQKQKRAGLTTEFDLRGVIDMHLHCAPDVEPRLADDIQTTRAAAEAGMRAIVFKSHVTQTADRATIAERVVGNIRVFGGLTLNYPVGGLNPAAVELAL